MMLTNTGNSISQDTEAGKGENMETFTDKTQAYEPLAKSAASSGNAAPSQHVGLFDTLCPNLAAKVRNFASTSKGFWILIFLSPVLLVLAFAALVYTAIFLSGPIMVSQAIWYVPELNNIHEEYERNGIPVKGKVTRHCRTKEKNQYNVTAVYEQDGSVYAKSFKYKVKGQSGLGISLGRVRLGFSEGPAFPQEMEFLVLPGYPASGQLREQAIQKEGDFQRALMVLLGPVVYFVFAYYMPKDQLSQVEGCALCQDATLFNLVSVVLLGLNLLLAKFLLPGLHAHNVKNLYEGARCAALEDMDVEQDAQRSVRIHGSGRGLQMSSTDQGHTQSFRLSFS